MSRGPKVWMTVFVDTDHAHDLVAIQSSTGIFMMLNMHLFVESFPTLNKDIFCEISTTVSYRIFVLLMKAIECRKHSVCATR